MPSKAIMSLPRGETVAGWGPRLCLRLSCLALSLPWASFVTLCPAVSGVCLTGLALCGAGPMLNQVGPWSLTAALSLGGTESRAAETGTLWAQGESQAQLREQVEALPSGALPDPNLPNAKL